MGLTSRIFRIPKPQRFLYALSLSTGASLITFSLLFNKLAGFYGILALFTGFELSPVQLSMYIYSVAALGLIVYLAPHIKTATSPLHCLALAWLYVLDSIVNAAYTAVFGITWFLVLINHHAGEPVGSQTGPGAGTIGDTAGFTDPQVNVSSVTIGDDGITHVAPASTPAGTSASSTAPIVWGRESINSVGIIIALWTLRAYLCLVMLAWARMVLRQHIAVTSARDPTTNFTSASRTATLAENPFDESKSEGAGWRGKLGRLMIGLGQSYWLGSDGDTDAWLAGASGKFPSTHRNGSIPAASGGSPNMTTNAANPAVELAKINSERENRRRSGTGPPLPSVAAAAGVINDSTDGGEAGRLLLKVPAR